MTDKPAFITRFEYNTLNVAYVDSPGSIIGGTVYARTNFKDHYKPKFALGDSVMKSGGSSWRGYVVGFYSTDLTKIGYCVESMYEPGSVQLYPEAALESYPKD